MTPLGDEHFPDATLIRVVLGTLNTHRIATLYETFGPAEARRIARKLEFHHTSKHGSWLNQAELELSVLTRQCLRRRIPSISHLRAKVRQWQKRRNAERASITWRFSAKDARKSSAGSTQHGPSRWPGSVITSLLVSH